MAIDVGFNDPLALPYAAAQWVAQLPFINRAFRGELRRVVNLPVSSITWPVQKGMSVFIDDRHNRFPGLGGIFKPGTLTDVTDWVDWETDQDTTLTFYSGAPSIFTILAIAGALGVGLDELIGQTTGGQKRNLQKTRSGANEAEREPGLARGTDCKCDNGGKRRRDRKDGARLGPRKSVDGGAEQPCRGHLARRCEGRKGKSDGDQQAISGADSKRQRIDGQAWLHRQDIARNGRDKRRRKRPELGIALIDADPQQQSRGQ